MASATTDPANAAHLKGRANKYLLLAGKLPGDAPQQQPSLQDQQQQQQQQSGKGD